MTMAQSSVSTAVRALELDVGAQLFEPTPIGVRLTPIGVRLRDHGVALALEIEQAFADLHAGRVGASEKRPVVIAGAPPGSWLDWAITTAAIAHARRGGARTARVTLPADATETNGDIRVCLRLAPADAPHCLIEAAGDRYRVHDSWRLLMWRGHVAEPTLDWAALSALKVMVAPFGTEEATRLTIGGLHPQPTDLDGRGAEFALVDRHDSALLVPASCLAAGFSSPALQIRTITGAPLDPVIEIEASVPGARALAAELAHATERATEADVEHPRLRVIDTRVDLHGLRCFASTVEHGNATRAAQARGVVQPSLSGQIKKLERAVRRSLFDRSGVGMTATKAGLRLYEMTAPVIAEHEATVMRLREAGAGPQRRTIRLGVIPAASETSLVARAAADALDAWRDDYPNEAVSVAEGFTQDLTRWVRGNVIDLAIIDTLQAQPGLKVRSILREPLVLVFAAGSKWDDGTKEIDCRELADVDLVSPSPQYGLRALTDRALSEAGVALRPALEIDGFALALRLVRTGRYATVLPPSAVHDDLLTGALRARLITAPTIERRLCLALRSAQPADTVIDALGNRLEAMFRRYAPRAPQ